MTEASADPTFCETRPARHATSGRRHARLFRRLPGTAAAGVLAPMILAGCSSLVETAATASASAGGVVSVATLVNTDKTIPDHVISLVTGHDCSLVRYSDGGYYCVKPAAPNKPIETRLYCYRSIGAITCYDTQIPGESHRLVTDPRHVVGARTVNGPAADPLPGQR